MTEFGGAAGSQGPSASSGDSRAVPPVVDVAISAGLTAAGMVARSATTAYRLVAAFRDAGASATRLARAVLAAARY